MNCKKCGSILKEGDKFCINCGTPVNQINEGITSNNNIVNNMTEQNSAIQNQSIINNTVNPNINNNYQNINNGYNNIPTPNTNSNKKKETLGTVSLVLGIISLILSFFLNILILPLAIVGLILGIINKAKKGKKIAGLILNIISILVIVVMLILTIHTLGSEGFFSRLLNEIEYGASNNYVAGKYNCTGVDSNTEKYLVTLHLNKDNTFLYGPYGRITNNYAKGTYTYEDENKTNGSGEYKYFMVTLEGKKEDFVIDGVSSDHDFKSQMEFGVARKDSKKQGIIMFVSTYNMYYCYEQ